MNIKKSINQLTILEEGMSEHTEGLGFGNACR